MTACARCGRCCVGLDVEVLAGFDMIPDYLFWEKDGLYYMRQHVDGRCLALGADNACTIYKTRPTVCRQFEPGGSECVRVRRCSA
jgi:Fe-S-cluster containining protein